MPYTYANNIRIHYKKSGKGKALILIHGLYSDLRSLSRISKILSRRYKVYSVDLPMHGLSEKPKKYLSVEDIAKILEKFISNLKIKNPAICSHSGGCIIAIEYASKHNLRELILIEPAGIKYSEFGIPLLIRILFTRFITSFLENPLRVLKIYDTTIHNMSRNIFNKNYWKIYIENYKKDFSRKMKKIRCPVIIMWGLYDELFLYKNSATFAKYIKNSKIIAVSGNHFWPALKPKEIYEYINYKKSISK